MDPRIQFTIGLLEREFSQPLVINKLARTVNLSSSRLCHLFKAETGLTVAQYLMRTRLKQARSFLEDTCLSVKEIVTLIGVGDCSRFARAFKKEYGLTPSEYRLASKSRAVDPRNA
jgi:transcriptional regulator GlxA family with amidase domain